METTIDTHICTINWLERLARLAKDNGKPLADTMQVETWTDVNVLINSQQSVMALIKELNVMTAKMISRKTELADMLNDKVWDDTIAKWGLVSNSQWALDTHSVYLIVHWLAVM